MKTQGRFARGVFFRTCAIAFACVLPTLAYDAPNTFNRELGMKTMACERDTQIVELYHEKTEAARQARFNKYVSAGGCWSLAPNTEFTFVGLETTIIEQRSDVFLVAAAVFLVGGDDQPVYVFLEIPICTD